MAPVVPQLRKVDSVTVGHLSLDLWALGNLEGMICKADWLLRVRRFLCGWVFIFGSCTACFLFRFLLDKEVGTALRLDFR